MKEKELFRLGSPKTKQQQDSNIIYVLKKTVVLPKWNKELKHNSRYIENILIPRSVNAIKKQKFRNLNVKKLHLGKGKPQRNIKKVRGPKTNVLLIWYVNRERI